MASPSQSHLVTRDEAGNPAQTLSAADTHNRSAANGAWPGLLSLAVQQRPFRL